MRPLRVALVPLLPSFLFASLCRTINAFVCVCVAFFLSWFPARGKGQQRPLFRNRPTGMTNDASLFKTLTLWSASAKAGVLTEAKTATEESSAESLGSEDKDYSRQYKQQRASVIRRRTYTRIQTNTYTERHANTARARATSTLPNPTMFAHSSALVWLAVRPLARSFARLLVVLPTRLTIACRRQLACSNKHVLVRRASKALCSLSGRPMQFQLFPQRVSNMIFILPMKTTTTFRCCRTNGVGTASVATRDQGLEKKNEGCQKRCDGKHVSAGNSSYIKQRQDPVLPTRRPCTWSNDARYVASIF